MTAPSDHPSERDAGAAGAAGWAARLESLVPAPALDPEPGPSIPAALGAQDLTLLMRRVERARGRHDTPRRAQAGCALALGYGRRGEAEAARAELDRALSLLQPEREVSGVPLRTAAVVAYLLDAPERALDTAEAIADVWRQVTLRDLTALAAQDRQDAVALAALERLRKDFYYLEALHMCAGAAARAGGQELRSEALRRLQRASANCEVDALPEDADERALRDGLVRVLRARGRETGEGGAQSVSYEVAAYLGLA